MKKLYLLIGAIFSSSLVIAEKIDIDKLNKLIKEKGYNWIAAKTSVSELSEEKQNALGGLLLPEPGSIDEAKINYLPIQMKQPPPQWDWRNHLGYNWMTPIKNQGDCGSCWAFSVIAPFEAGLKIIWNKPDTNIDLAEQFLVSCDRRNNGCRGGLMQYACMFLEDTGCPDEACFRYQAEDLPCNNRCQDWQQRVIKINDWGQVSAINAIKNAIMYYGPISVGMDVYEDFLHYSGGVYRYTTGNLRFRHAVSILGWNDGLQCWIGKNFWGPGWGESGWFKIGYGECGMFSRYPGIWIEVMDMRTPQIRIYNQNVNEPNDGFWDPGEQISIIITLTNAGDTATNVIGTLSTTDGSISITNNTFNFGTINTRAMVDNSSNPYTATVSASATPRDVIFNLRITADGYSRILSFKVPMGIRAGTVKQQFTISSAAYGLAHDGTYLWVSVWNRRKIYKINPQTGARIDSIRTPTNDTGWVDIDYDWITNRLWLQNVITRRIYKINPATGTAEATITSPGPQYPTGLAFDGSTLWIADRNAYRIYNIRTDGSSIGNFAIPISPRPIAGPRGLAFEPRGPGGGTLLLVMTHFRQTGQGHTLDSTCVYEITKNGQLIQNHKFHIFPRDIQNARGIEFDPNTGDYWVCVPNFQNNTAIIYRVAGFYRQGIEEKEKKIFDWEFTVMPNPAVNDVTIRFTAPKITETTIRIYDISGKLVYSITNKVEKGANTIVWDGKDNYGNKLPSGIYYCRLQTDKYTTTRKILLIR